MTGLGSYWFSRRFDENCNLNHSAHQHAVRSVVVAAGGVTIFRSRMRNPACRCHYAGPAQKQTFTH